MTPAKANRYPGSFMLKVKPEIAHDCIPDSCPSYLIPTPANPLQTLNPMSFAPVKKGNP